MLTLGELSPLHLQAVHDGQIMSGRRKKENGSCAKSKTGQVLLALYPQLYEPYTGGCLPAHNEQAAA